MDPLLISPVCAQIGGQGASTRVWKDVTSKGSGVKDVVNYLEKCIDPQFPEVTKCRTMWSYKNGVFLGKALDPLTNEYTCKFLPYESREFQKLDPTLASCKFFNTDFEDFSMVEDWFDIPTPHFAKILDYQRLPKMFSDGPMSSPADCALTSVISTGGKSSRFTGDRAQWQVASANFCF